MHAHDQKPVEKFKNFILDEFQIDAIKAIERHHSVVVSAATGTGKTLIADYAINKFMKMHKRVVYTAPIKALSNQKYRDFKQEYGEENVGIMTGDVVINPTAPLLLMTTEIYRNMLVTKDPFVESISYVVFDEIHFMSDIERGTVWEESIIFSPKSIRFLCLSATIPNSQEFADWISNIKEHPVEVVKNAVRAVPLQHYVFDIDHGIITIEKAYQMQLNHQLPDYYKIMRKQRQKHKTNDKPRVPKHFELVKELKASNDLPCIFFVFSRQGCEDRAKELMMRQDFLDADQKEYVIRLFFEKVQDQYLQLTSVQLIKALVQKGIGVHHAGMLPALKEVVEILFSQGLLKVLYATETFAVGINMPAKTVCFNSLVKYDGHGFGFMKSKDYFQMAGRAGRRGLDKFGKAISLLERRNELPKVRSLTSSDSEPIISQFQLSPNTVLNMLNNHTEEEIEVILKSNFDYFIKKRSDASIRIKARFNNLVKRLTQLEYLTHDKKLTGKGRFATKIYSHELLITEIFSTKLYEHLQDYEICMLVAAIVYEARRNDEFMRSKQLHLYDKLLKKVLNNHVVREELNKDAMKALWAVVNAWINGVEFSELMDMSTYQEGDYIRLFRQMSDYMHQIAKATEDFYLQERMMQCINLVYRDVVRFELWGS